MVIVRNRHGRHSLLVRSALTVTIIAITFLAAACSQIQRPAAEPFYAQTAPPPRQEFRWSNGKTPKSLDPARAAAAPETNIIGAIYEGLTDLDSKTLDAVPGVAETWESTTDHKTWTFHLRKDAKWSNGSPVTARDFARSWQRFARLGDRAANRQLYSNIVGVRTTAAEAAPAAADSIDFLVNGPAEQEIPLQQLAANSGTETRSQTPPANTAVAPEPAASPKKADPAADLGIEAVDDQTLRVSLVTPDKDFPKLVSNPVFAPVYGDGALFEKAALDKGVVTNGPFRVIDISNEGLSLERAEYYWDHKNIELERVRFVPMVSAEKALEAYRAGSIDAITNANFEPLALKLLTPYEDFRRTTYSALNFYEFNLGHAPFSDRRIREALAMAIDRERLTEGELEGSVEPATGFLLHGTSKEASITLDVEHAKDNLVTAGYPNGEGFPQIRLLINRNNTQQRIARTIARMWKQNLNIDTQIVVKETAELEAAKAAGDFDLIRRGAVLPTVDESVALGAIFDLPARALEIRNSKILTEPETDLQRPGAPTKRGPSDEDAAKEPAEINTVIGEEVEEFTELDAIFEVRAIPLYFPKSYSLVKPYVRGFEMNSLDAPSLKDVTIDSSWKPKPPKVD